MGGLGMQELIIIMVIALIVFGPRKLPDLGKSLGKAMGQFKRASEDFKRTWEQEVDLEKTRSSIAESSSSPSTSYDENHHSYDGSYDPYNSDYGYNAPSDAPGNGEAAATETVPHEAVTEPATATTTTPATATNKPQPGQWI